MDETNIQDANRRPTTVADLNLPPTFLADHCVRTLFYQGALSPIELARHWHVQPDISVEVVENLKADGLVQSEGIHKNFERHARVDLTPAGRKMVAAARDRTWYAGPLPVSVAEFSQRVETSRAAAISRRAIRGALGARHFDESIADEIGQALRGGAIVSVIGTTAREQPAIAASIGSVVSGDVALPYALFAAGAIVRLVDARYHSVIAANENDQAGTSRTDEDGRWTRVETPVVTLKGGAVVSDMVPAYDEEAKFYIAPAPLAACGGMLAVLHCDLTPDDALAAFARLWLVPGRSRAAVLFLRSGERIEVPWHTSTLLLSTCPLALPPSIRAALPLHVVDASLLQPVQLRAYLTNELRAGAFPDRFVELAAERLEAESTPTRAIASAFGEYLRSRAEYEGKSFRAALSILDAAIEYATASASPGETAFQIAA